MYTLNKVGQEKWEGYGNWEKEKELRNNECFDSAPIQKENKSLLVSWNI